MMLVIEEFLDTRELADYRHRLEQVRWHSGSHTAGGLSALAKQNEQANPASKEARDLSNRLLRKMGHHATLISACLPHRIHPPVFNRYGLDQSYGTHVDSAIMPMGDTGQVLRSDVSMTLFLSAADAYDGGELVIEGESGAQSVKLDAGDLVLYPSGRLHRVNAVTRGERLAAIAWIQSLVGDAFSRSLLFELDQSIQSLTRCGTTEEAELLRLSAVYHNLVRHLAQV